MAGTKLRKTAIALFLSAMAQSVLADGLTDQAKTLIDAGKAKEAFILLDVEENTRAGDPLFDLLFGIAAIESGQNTRAVFALERVLAMQPNNARARAEIARAYLALGETATAKQEFETVQKQGVPPEVSATIDRFLDAVDRIDSVTRPTLRGYIEAGFGYDTNVNAATAKSSIAVPGFGGVIRLEDSSQDAGFGTLGGGLNLRNPINTELAFVAGFSSGCACLAIKAGEKPVEQGGEVPIRLYAL